MKKLVHKVYTEILDIHAMTEEFVGFLACEESNQLQEQGTMDVELTTEDKEVTCPQCLWAIKGGT